MRIRTATAEDWPAIWAIFGPILRQEESYLLPADSSEVGARAYWMDGKAALALAEIDQQVLGAYYLKAAQSGLGDHTANAGFIVAPAARGQGIGAQLCIEAEAKARSLGFRAMQFSFVVASNPAIRLWTRLGYKTVGWIPEAYRHRQLGLVDALVMWKTLLPPAGAATR